MSSSTGSGRASARVVQSQRADDWLRRAQDGHGADRAAGLQSVHYMQMVGRGLRGEVQRRHGSMSRGDGPGQPGAIPGPSSLPLLQALLRSAGLRDGLRQADGGQRRCSDPVPDDERHPRPLTRARAYRPQLSSRSRVPIPPGRRRPSLGRPDIVLPRHRVALFVHGCFWHRHRGCRFTTTPSTNADFWKAKFTCTSVHRQVG